MFKLKTRWLVISLTLTVAMAMLVSPVWGATMGPQKAPRVEPMEELTTIRLSTQMWLAENVSVHDLIAQNNTQRIWTAYCEGLLHKVYNIAIEAIAFPIYGAQAAPAMLAGLAAGTAPSVMRTNEAFGGSVAAAVVKGLAADITPYIGYVQEHLLEFYPYDGYRNKWNQAWVDGKCYGLLPFSRQPEPLTILYRKDWFKEAGLFGSDGTPAPPANWTVDEFAEISRKITDPKKDRFGFLLAAGDTGTGKEFVGWMDQFGAQMVMPDKTGENTYSAAFELAPMVNLLSFFKDMTFKDKSLLTGVEYESWITDPFFGGRSGMFSTWAGQANWRAVHNDQTYAPQSFEEVIGIAPLPIGPQGINAGLIIGGCELVNPFQTDAQIEATVKFMIFTYFNEYREIRDMAAYWEGSTDQPVGYGSPAYFLEDPWDALPMDYRKVHEDALNLPTLPIIDEFGMYIPSKKTLELELLPALQMILTSPNADVAAELKKAANIANRSALRGKAEGITAENFKEYYTALGEWYQKNAPDFYKEFQSNLEKYYKVW